MAVNYAGDPNLLLLSSVQRESMEKSGSQGCGGLEGTRGALLRVARSLRVGPETLSPWGCI